jgi:integrase
LPEGVAGPSVGFGSYHIVEVPGTGGRGAAIRFHDLRHTCATLLLSQGVHPKVVQERLGHANIAMTMNLYSHVTADMQRHAAETLDAAIAEVARSA